MELKNPEASFDSGSIKSRENIWFPIMLNDAQKTNSATRHGDYIVGKQQQGPIVSSSWWSLVKIASNTEQDDKGKSLPVEGVIQSGALNTLPPPREVARPEMKKSLLHMENLDEEEWRHGDYIVRKQQQGPVVSSNWWSPVKIASNTEKDDKEKSLPVEGVIQPGVLITLLPRGRLLD
ncbi:unnamed protein product [Fraxinus pennsylvanica]|uniref:Uncharacterized protein n=1 Tax=Fraxinus pennsylvanica TaxID=56036 RepID=A0AAD2A4I7_9LAMI|nr:unnamed protein product [Fraxinus pennsylvanica]